MDDGLPSPTVPISGRPREFTGHEATHRSVRSACLLGLCFAFLPANPAVAAEGAPSVDARPGVYRVGTASVGGPAIAGTLGYGYTEKQTPTDGAHSRVTLKLAAASGILPWLGFGISGDARYDHHGDSGGTVIDPALTIRAAVPVGSLKLGVDLRGFAPGAETLALMADGASFDAVALAGVDAGLLFIAAKGGYRLDRSANSVEAPDSLGFGDRMALGVSDFDQALLGIGASVALGRQTELLVEASADLLVGDGAPPLQDSPLRAGAGVRHRLLPALSLQVFGDVSLSSRPELGPGAPLVPIEPRFSLFAGVVYEFGRTTAAPAPSAETAPPPPPPPPVVVKAPPSVTELVVAVADEQGNPVPNAKVSLTIGATVRELAPGEPGKYRISELAAATGKVRVEAPEFEPEEREVRVEGGRPNDLAIRLRAVPPPSQIRGVVRSFAGRPVAARVRVEPVGLAVVASADGSFELDVPPGSYEVVIEADGFVPQRRKVQVDPQGVVVLNADLSKK